jgi:phosphate transport system substrate-binding protein
VSMIRSTVVGAPRAALIGVLVAAVASSALAAGTRPGRETRFGAPATAGPRETIVVRGSTTWEPINAATPSRFAVVAPKIELDIETPPLGSTGGVRALIEGACIERGVGLTDANADGRLDCDVNNDGVVAVPDATTGGPGAVPTIAQSSRPLTAGEYATAAAAGLDLVAVQGGRDGLAMIVHSSNPIAQLSKANVVNMYLNPAGADWGLYGGNCPDPERDIKLYSRNTNGGTFDSFIDLFIGSANRAAFLARVASGDIVLVDTALDGVAAVAADPCGIFYAGIGDFATEPSVRAVPAYVTIPPGILPTQQTVQSGAYPFSRGMFLATIGVPSVTSAEGRYIDWMLSRSGQSVVYENGFVPSYEITPAPLVRDSLLSTYPAP